MSISRYLKLQTQATINVVEGAWNCLVDETGSYGIVGGDSPIDMVADCYRGPGAHELISFEYHLCHSEELPGFSLQPGH